SDSRAVQVDLVAQLALAQRAPAAEHRQDGVLRGRDIRRHEGGPGRHVPLLCPAQQVASVTVGFRLGAAAGHAPAAARWPVRNPAKKLVSSSRADSGRTFATYWSGRTITSAPARSIPRSAKISQRGSAAQAFSQSCSP